MEIKIIEFDEWIYIGVVFYWVLGYVVLVDFSVEGIGICFIVFWLFRIYDFDILNYYIKIFMFRILVFFFLIC